MGIYEQSFAGGAEQGLTSLQGLLRFVAAAGSPRARQTRGWMIAGGSVEILKNRIAEEVFDRRVDQRERQPTAAE